MKINIRGQLNAMKVNESIALPKDSCKPSSVRCIAALLKNDTGKSFSVNATGSEYITVIRVI